MKVSFVDTLFISNPASEIYTQLFNSFGQGSLGDAVADVQAQYDSWRGALIPASDYIVTRVHLVGVYDDNLAGNRYSASLLVEYVVQT